MRTKWNKGDTDFLILNYGKLSNKDISEKLNRTSGSVFAKATKVGLTTKLNRYHINEKYFDVIDEENKAYWLGFLWSDGYVMKRNRSSTYTYELNFRLKADDVTTLERFRSDIESNHPVKILKNSSSSLVKDKDSSHCKLYICNNYFCKRLYDTYGIVPNRYDISKILNNLPKQLERHFMRGLLDGDGSFSRYESKQLNTGNVHTKYNVTFGGSEEVLNFCQNHLIENEIINNSDRKFYKRHIEKELDGVFLTLSLSGRIQVLNVLNYLYDDSVVYLERKYEKYLQIKN